VVGLLCVSEAAKLLLLDCKHLEKPVHRLPPKNDRRQVETEYSHTHTEEKGTLCCFSDKTFPIISVKKEYEKLIAYCRPLIANIKVIRYSSEV